MEALQLDLNKKYSYADYLTWADEIRRELFEGLVKLMSPAPSRKHQLVSTALTGIFYQFLKNKKCQLFHAPSDVRFPNKGTKCDEETLTVVQPDLYVVCDLSKLDDRGCCGAPDFIAEIVSEKNSKRDVKEKFDLYQKYGVKEYWTIFPHEKIVNVFLLDESGKYQYQGSFAEDDLVPVNIFNGELQVDLKELFE